MLRDPLVSRANDTWSKGSTAGSDLDFQWRTGVHLLGGFRPLLVDLLWLRADALLHQGRLWELKALFEGITALDPDNRMVREYAAWHLAYNVVLAEPDPSRRFAWFEDGMELLRKGGGSEAWRLRVAGAGMLMDRHDSGVFPNFEEKVRERWGGHPFEVAAGELEEVADGEGTGAVAFVYLLACYERLRLRAHEAGRDEEERTWAERKAGALQRAVRRFPMEDWDFAHSK